MATHSKPVRPEALGIIGEDHLRAKFEAAGCAMDTFRCKTVKGSTGGVPWIIEAAFAWWPSQDRLVGEDGGYAKRQLITGAGWTMLGGLLWLDVAGLGMLVMASDLFPVPLLMLLGAFAITFGAVAMGSAIMGLGRSGGPAGMNGRGLLRPAPRDPARMPLPGSIRAGVRRL